MSSTDSTEIAKTDDSSLASDLDKSLSDSISKKFSNVEIAYVKPDRIRVNVKKEEIICKKDCYMIQYAKINLKGDVRGS